MNLFFKCAVAVASSATQSLGLTLQRASYLTPFLGASERSNIYMWRAGVILFVLANLLGSTVQIALLPLALVCTLQAAGLVANSFFAWLLLHEPLNRSAIAGTVLVITGAVFVAALGGMRQADPDLSLDKLIKLFYDRHFVFYMGISIALIVAGIYKAQTSTQLRSSTRGVIYGLVGGTLSAHSLLMAKIVISLLVRDFTKIFNDLSRPKFWIAPICFLIFALGQMWCVNSGLQRVSTSVLYPLVFCVYNVVTLLNGLAFYGLEAMFEPKQLGFVVIGTAILFFGVGLLSSRLDDDEPTGVCDLEQGSSLNTAMASPVSTTMPNFISQRSETATNSTLDDAPISPRTRPPLINKPSADSPLLDLATGPQYTSFESLNPNIANPDKSRHRSGRHGLHGRGRVLSKEQQDILRELYM